MNDSYVFSAIETYASMTKKDRICLLIDVLETLPPFSSSLEAYVQLSNILNRIEDYVFGSEYWNPPRTYSDGSLTPRLYPSQPECFERVDGFEKVLVMVHSKEFIFISNSGAIQMQTDTGQCERTVPFSNRIDAVIFDKVDIDGQGVWQERNRGVRSIAGPLINETNHIPVDWMPKSDH